MHELIIDDSMCRSHHYVRFGRGEHPRHARAACVALSPTFGAVGADMLASTCLASRLWRAARALSRLTKSLSAHSAAVATTVRIRSSSRMLKRAALFARALACSTAGTILHCARYVHAAANSNALKPGPTVWLTRAQSAQMRCSARFDEEIEQNPPYGHRRSLHAAEIVALLLLWQADTVIPWLQVLPAHAARHAWALRAARRRRREQGPADWSA